MAVETRVIEDVSWSAEMSGWARRVGSSHAMRIAAVVAVFAWYPRKASPWFSMIDPDVWWHMRSGEWILQHHRLPRTDPFSITGAGKPWVAYSWPFGVLIQFVARHWDLIGVVAFTIGSWMVLTATLLWLIRGALKSFWPSVVLAFLGGVVLDRVVAPRPGNFSIFFFMVVLRILIDARNSPKGGRSASLLFLLPAIVWMWANVHLQFIYGLALIGAFALEPLLGRCFGVTVADARRTMRLWGALAVSTLVTMVTPYGAGAWRVIWEFLHQPQQYALVAEFHAMAFNRTVNYIVLFLALAAAMCLGQMKRKAPVWFVLFLFGVVQGFHMERDIWVLTVISIAVIATWLAERSSAPESVPRFVWLGAAACVLAIFAYAVETGPSNRELMGRVADEYPVGAVAYIHEHHLQGPIFNNFDWGGFLIYALPEFPVAIDGRTNVHGQDELTRSMDTWNLMGDWHEDPLLVNANLVIGSPKFALTHALAMDSRFKMAFNDGVAVVYERVGR